MTQQLTRSMESLRRGFVSSGGHTLIDSEVTISSPRKMLAYFPRGLGIAVLSPFPWQWLEASGRTGRLRCLATIEVLLIYFLLAGVLFRLRVIRGALELQTVIVMVFILLIAIPMALAVANVGTLFRLRLQFLLPFVLVVCLADVSSLYRHGIERVWKLVSARRPASPTGHA